MIAKMILKMSEQVKAIAKKLVVGCYVFLRVKNMGCEWSEEEFQDKIKRAKLLNAAAAKQWLAWELWFVTRLRHFVARRSWWHGAYALWLKSGGVSDLLRGTTLRFTLFLSQSLAAPSHVWCFAFLFWDLRVYILRGNAEDSRYGRWPPQWDWTFTAADYCKKGKSVKQQQEGMPFKFHSWMHVVRIWTRWQLPKASNFSFFVEMFVVALY